MARKTLAKPALRQDVDHAIAKLTTALVTRRLPAKNPRARCSPEQPSTITQPDSGACSTSPRRSIGPTPRRPSRR